MASLSNPYKNNFHLKISMSIPEVTDVLDSCLPLSGNSSAVAEGGCDYFFEIKWDL